MQELLRHTRFDLAELVRVGRGFIEALRQRQPLGSGGAELKAWLGRLQQLLTDTVGQPERAELEVYLEPLAEFLAPNEPRPIVVDELLVSVFQLTAQIESVMRSHRCQPSVVEDASFASFLHAAVFEDKLLGLGAWIVVERVARRARVSLPDARRCLARLVDEELGYQTGAPDMDAFKLDRDEIVFALETLERPRACSLVAPSGGTATRAVSGGADDVNRAVILTALGLEFEAVRRHLSDPREVTHPSGTIYELGRFEAGSNQWEIAIAEIGAGNEGAAQHVERATAHFRPRVVLFVGVAGGIKDVKLGDVVASTKVYAYHAGKDAETFQPRPEVAMPSHALEQRARSVARRGAWVQRLVPGPTATPQAFVGPIAAGEVVVASVTGPVYRLLRSNYGDALTVEMEGHGFLAAVRAVRGVEALVVRGVSDLVAGKAEADAHGSQPDAARHASAFAFEVLAQFDPRTLETSGRA